MSILKTEVIVLNWMEEERHLNFWLKLGTLGDLQPLGFQTPILATKKHSRQSFFRASSLIIHHFFLSIDNGTTPQTTRLLYSDPK
jgi:hypothetical protein